MIRLARGNLPTVAEAHLASQTAALSAASPESVKQLAAIRWKNRSSGRFAEIRTVLRDMCSGHERCMYCEDSAATDIDHFCPRAVDPLLAFVWTNYLLACSTCNSNFKRAEYPVGADGSPLLIDPTTEDPMLHLDLSPSTGRYVPQSDSAKGSESIRVFGLNRELLEAARRDAWVLLQAIVVAYGDAMERDDQQQADRYADLVRHVSHAQVWATLAQSDADSGFVDAKCIEFMGRYPEIRDWALE
jgi:uncharacterized protein (TIGR02646 family)